MIKCMWKIGAHFSSHYHTNRVHLLSMRHRYNIFFVTALGKLHWSSTSWGFYLIWLYLFNHWPSGYKSTCTNHLSYNEINSLSSFPSFQIETALWMLATRQFTNLSMSSLVLLICWWVQHLHCRASRVLTRICLLHKMHLQSCWGAEKNHELFLHFNGDINKIR